MKKSNGQKAIETHNLSQAKYPLPGTDLHFTTAVPERDVYDVDENTSGDKGQFTQVKAGTRGGRIC